MRDPYRALISYWHLTQTQEHTGHTQAYRLGICTIFTIFTISQSTVLALPRFQTETFASFVAQGLGRWLQTVQDWAQHSTSLHLVFYEVRSNNSVSISCLYLPTIVYQQ